MANDADDLRINTLHALTKHSPRAILEEHSHCEVPAGCGGVVLRWRDPTAGVPGVLRVVGSGSASAWIDGVAATNSWVSLHSGGHVLAVEMTDLPDHPTPFVALVNRQSETGVLMTSEPSALWRIHPDPPEGWQAPDFDDSGWAQAVDATALVEALSSDDGAWRFRSPMDAGAVPLRLPPGRAVLRGRFTIAEHP